MQIDFSLFLEVASRALTIYVGVFAGFLFMKSPLRRYRGEFVSLTINFFTPLLIIWSFVGINFEKNWFIPVVGGLLVTIFGIITPNGLAFLFKQESPSPAELSTSSFSNALNFPFPIIFALVPGGLSAAGIFFAISVLTRNTIGFWIARSELRKNYLKDLLFFPPIWGIVLGMIIRIFAVRIAQPIIIHSFAQILFQIGIFATLMTLGFSLKKPKIDDKMPLVRVSISRFIVSGILATCLIILFKPSAIIGIPLIVQMMAPPAVYNGLYAEKLGLNTELTSQIILTLTIIALIILPVELLALQLIYFSNN